MNKQENTTHEKKETSINIHRLRNDPKDRFVDKNIKTIVVTIFHMFKKVEEGLNVLSRDIEDTIMTQIKLLDMKNRIYEI